MNMTIYEYKSRCEWLAKFYAEAAETGRAMQVLACGGWVDCDESPSIQSIPDNWRIKPEPQKAWVVWGPGGPSTILGESYAKQYARECGGTIQEITRPEPQ
jgi:hypothetical protein